MSPLFLNGRKWSQLQPLKPQRHIISNQLCNIAPY